MPGAGLADGAALALAWGLVAGTAAQLLVQLPAARRLGLLRAPRLVRREPGLGRVRRLLPPAALRALAPGVPAQVAGAGVQAALLLRGLLRCGAWSFTRGLGHTLPAGVLGSAAMAAALLWVAPAGAAWFEAGALGSAALLGAAVAGGAVLYAVAVVALGVRPAHLRLGA